MPTQSRRSAKILFFSGLFLVAVVLSFVVINITRQNPPYGADPESNPVTPAPEVAKLDFPLAVLAKFKNPRQEISLEELGNKISGQVFIDETLRTQLSAEELQNITALFNASAAGLVSFSETDFNKFNDSKYPDDAILITHFAKQDFRLKLLTVAGKYLWRDQDYPMRVSFERVGQSQTEFEEKMASSLGITLEDLVFDSSKVNRIFYGGEIIPARAVDRLFLNTTNNYTFLFDRFASEMKSADLTIAMLENPISGDPKPCTGCTQFVGDGRNAKGFAEVGIDLLASGNHFGDGGLKALQDSETLLKAQGIGLAGVSSKNLKEAEQVQIRDFAGKKLGLVGFDDVGYFYWASSTHWGANHFSKSGTRGNAPDFERIKQVITEAKSQVDYLVVYASWGIEYTDTANAAQQQMAHAFIDNGADIVMASHPHWVQNFESYKGKPIFYSLGNFIFDQTHTEPTRQAMLLNAYYFHGKLMGFQFMPDLNCGYHQTKNNLANQVIDGKMTYAQVDATPEKNGCIYFQPKQVYPGNPVYQQIWSRFTKSVKLN